MQRVSALLPSWGDRSGANAAASSNGNNNNNNNNRSSRPVPGALTRVFGWAATSAANRNSTTSTTVSIPTSVVRQTYWPSTLDKECDKAARILKSFCTDGFLAADGAGSRPTSPISAAQPTNYVTKKIPARIIQNAYGLAIFSCMRSGLWMSGSGGSGILIARKADGTWSPPAGILLHTAEVAFVMGVDIYDCVLVINSVSILELFTRSRVTLGADVNLSVGPLVTSESLDANIRWKELENNVLTYVKARGKHQGVPLDGSLVQERGNENERFYGGMVNTLDILAGNTPKSVPETKPLFEVIKAAEGRTDFDEALMRLLSQQPAPGDAVIEETPADSPLSPLTSPMQASFGIPDKDDPDPFGVIALEMAGLEIKEAGSKLRPTSSQFEYNPSPTSPMFSKFNRQSIDTYLSKSNRGSYMSSRTQGTAMTDAGTQTDVATPGTTLSHANSEDGRDNMSEKLPTVMEPEEIDYTKIDSSAIEHLSRPQSKEPPSLEETPDDTPVNEEPPQMKSKGVGTEEVSPIASPTLEIPEEQHDCDADDEDDEDEDEEPVIVEVVTAQPARTVIRATQVAQVIQAKGALVHIPGRKPPPLPPRSPARTSRASKSEFGGDVSSLRSPLRSSFQSSDLRSEGDADSLRSPLRSSFVSAEEGDEQREAQPHPTVVQHATEAPELAEAPSPSADAAATTSAKDDDDVAMETAESAKRVSGFQAINASSHKKNSSTASSVHAHITDQDQQHRWSSCSSSRTPPPPDPTLSSAEESEREPKTPKPEDDFRASRTGTAAEKQHDFSGAKDVAIEAHHADTNTIAVA